MLLEKFSQEEREKNEILQKESTTSHEKHNAFLFEIEKKQTDHLSNDIPLLIKRIKGSIKETIKTINKITETMAKEDFYEKTVLRKINGIFLSGHYFTIPPQDISILKEELLSSYTYQLNLLKEKVPEYYEEIINFINNIVEQNQTKNYALMKQGTATNKLSKLKSKEKYVTIDPITGSGTMTWDDFSITMKNFSEIAGFRTSTHKLIDALLIEFTETGSKDTKITMPLKKYMELRNLKDEKTARKQVDEDLETLYNASISFKQKLKNGRKSQNYLDMRLVIDKGIKRGIIQCTFHPDFYNLMNSYQVMPMAKKALALNDKRNPNAYYFLKELCEHMNMNYGKPNQNLISVITLLKSTPEIPTYKEIANKNRGYRQLIIDPFERDMEALEAINALKWEYCHSNALPLNDEELQNIDYEIFSKLLIHFELIDYPSRKITPKIKNKKKKK